MENSKTVLITGCGRGIGRAVTNELISRGHKVVAVTRQIGCFDEGFDQSRASRRLIPVYCAVDSSSGREKLYTLLKEEKIIADAVLNNAGLLIKKPLPELEEDDMIDMYRVNCIVPLLLASGLASRGLLAREYSITNISSMAGVEDSSKYPGLAGYSASKAAVNALTQAMAVEMPGGYINALAPGAIGTEMQKEAFPGLESAVTADDFAHFAADFIIENHRFFNGQILKVKLADP